MDGLGTNESLSGWIGLANERWMKFFLEAKVHHTSMSALGHCLLTLFLRKSMPSKPAKKRFFFEAMCTRDERCKEVIETAWDPLNGNLEF